MATYYLCKDITNTSVYYHNATFYKDICFHDTGPISFPVIYAVSICIPYLVYIFRAKQPISLFFRRKRRNGPIHPMKVILCLFYIAAHIVESVYLLKIAFEYNLDISAIVFRISVSSALGVLILAIALIELRKNILTSTCLFVMWLLLLIVHAFRLVSAITESWYLDDKRYVAFGCTVVNVAIVLLQTVIYGFVGPKTCNQKLPSDTEGENANEVPIVNVNSNTLFTPDEEEVETIASNPVSPESNSSVMSILSYWWMTRFVIKGWRRPIQPSHIYQLPFSNQSRRLFEHFQSAWDKVNKIRFWEAAQKHDDVDGTLLENSDHSRKSQQSSPAPVIKALLKTVGQLFFLTGIVRLAVDTCLLAAPILMMKLTRYTQTYKERPVWEGYAIVVVMLFVGCCQVAFHQRYWYFMAVTSIRIRAVLSSAIFDKILKISNTARQKVSIGEATNLVASDSSMFLIITMFLHLLWAAPLQLTVIILLLWLNMGVSTFAGVGVTVLSIILSGIIAKISKRFQLAKLKKKDARLKIANEVFENIKAIKTYAWENALLAKISQAREEELSFLRKYLIMNLSTQSIWLCAPIFATLATFAAYLYQNENANLDPSRAFVSLVLFNMMRINLVVLPQAISNTVQYMVSLKRIATFLMLEELDPNAVDHQSASSGENAIEVENGNFSWNSMKNIENNLVLSQVNLSIERGKLVAIVGEVGSGKSSLLSALLGEMTKVSGQVVMRGKVAVLPQTAWIQNATLKDNITFSLPFDSKFYRSIIKACALRPDIQVMANGDDTKIGDKGMNLSGGQKQRVALARAIYTRSDVYLLDDTLSAVDSYTGQHLFNYVIGPSGLLATMNTTPATRIWVTHKLNYLSQCDHIIFMSAGKITAQGSFTNLISSCPEFRTMVEHVKTSEQVSTSSAVENDSSVHQVKVGKSLSLPASAIRKFSLTKSPQTKRNTINELEKVEEGAVKLDVYKIYIKSMGAGLVVLYCLVGALASGVNIFAQHWLALWTNEVAGNATAALPRRDNNFLVYSMLNLVQTVLSTIGTILVGVSCFRASRNLHSDMLTALLRSTIQFFEKTPASRILNRFSKDMDTVDMLLIESITKFAITFFFVLSTFVIIAIKLPYLLIVAVPIFISALFLQRIYAASIRQLKRIELASQSPVLNHLSETFAGASSIRAFARQGQFLNKFSDLIDVNHAAYYVSQTTVGWILVHTEFVGVLVVFTVALMGVVQVEVLDPSAAAFTLSFAVLVGQIMFFGIQHAALMEANVVSVERLNEYVDSPKEPAWFIPETDKTPEMQKWPAQGTINFQNVVFSYREDLEPALRHLSFAVRPAEKIGIVGRTGAGKSSLGVVLLRISEMSSGRILIDGVDSSKIGLHVLRNAITPIPQDPVLFSGTLRFNLDPFLNHSDEAVKRSLQLVTLEYLLDQPDGLDMKVTESGSNFSAGQKQLLCLARALLRRPPAGVENAKTHILLMDEATAAVDLATDRLITEMIKQQFADCTVITIAHRLETILSYDRVLVLAKGQAVEFDSPGYLLNNPNSYFYSLAKSGGLI